MSKTIYLHNSDRTTFKRCRRKWDFSSPFRQNLRTKVENHKPFWFGSALHFAFEDFHGYRKHGTLEDAFLSYVDCFNPDDLPSDIEELITDGKEMLKHYESWLPTLDDKFKTVWLDGKPLVEVNFELYFDDLSKLSANGERICYGGTFDRIVEDKDGNWYILDYKTAKVFDTSKLATDQQISAYLWAAEQVFNREFEGFVYLQLSKNPPSEPKVLKKGTVSVAKTQRTTPILYRKKLNDVYGDNFENECTSEELDFLKSLEDDFNNNQSNYSFGDVGIQVNIVTRSQTHIENTYVHIINEGKEMLNPNIAIYPNFTKDCSWDCQFKDACLSLEDIGDWDFYMDLYEVREEDNNDDVKPWRLNLYRLNPNLYPEEQHRFRTCDDLEGFIDNMK